MAIATDSEELAHVRQLLSDSLRYVEHMCNGFFGNYTLVDHIREALNIEIEDEE